ncbi:winged helix-turn-helix transcriptional regulator [Enterococcus sp. 669A]|uniref:Winged helix-turn-helix transcriptional regulator n=1 Tax=Candidatus Enterococcus moelleringii TaxID=2815325 RepID=A0ABS3LG96_9ENTE|nr:winged helix-turn-helix domain-containing protein [Enterococcus sp. 669A]MBO1308058.1 winged helix-turn-helix transcriptional regulator [Enterococcus sp. 669A]
MTSLPINNQLNPYFETFFLLYQTPFDEKAQQETLADLDELGLDGLSFYEKHYPVIEAYYSRFEEQRIPTACDFFFQEVETDYLITLAFLLFRYSFWNDELSTMSDAQLQQLIISFIYLYIHDEEPPENATTLQAIQQLGQLEFPDSVKWQITNLLQQPRPILAGLIEAVKTNLPAFEAAKAAVENDLAPLLEKYQQNMQNESFLRQMTRNLELAATITPTLAVPMSVLILENQCYYGLLCDHVQRSGGNSALSKEDLLVGLKAISDKTKLEILAYLKEKPSYNLELAEHLNLAPATISHHMNALLNSGFVKIEKKNKAYYVLNEESIEHFIHELRRELLK